MRSATREHAGALRSDRQAAAQELAALRERAEDAERRLEASRHSAYATQQLTIRENSISPKRDGAKRPVATTAAELMNEEDAVLMSEDEQWQSLRRQQVEVGASQATRLSELGGGPRRGASAALLRRAALLSEGTPRTAGRGF